MAEAKETPLRRKLFLARKAAKAVKKRGQNTEGDYTFARAEDVLAEASKQLERKGILILPSLVDEKLYFSQSGFTIAKVVIEFEVIDSQGDESLKVRWSGTGHDSPGDKALFKATTGTTKYFLANLLGIPFGTDPEAETDQASARQGGEDPDRLRRAQDADAEA